MLQTEVVTDLLNLSLRRVDDQAADSVPDSHERVAVELLGVLVVAELPAPINGAAAFLLLLPPHRADVVVVGAAARVVD